MQAFGKFRGWNRPLTRSDVMLKLELQPPPLMVAQAPQSVMTQLADGSTSATWSPRTAIAATTADPR